MAVIRIGAIRSDVTDVPVDVLLLKNTSGGLVGPEAAVNEALGGLLEEHNSSQEWKIGHATILRDLNGIAASAIVLVGVGKGREIKYDTLSLMCSAAVEKICESFPEAKSIATVIHAVGFGLDPREAFRAILFGLKAALEKAEAGTALEAVIFSVLGAGALGELSQWLEELEAENDSPIYHESGQCYMRLGMQSSSEGNFKRRVKQDSYVFVAMPFAKRFANVYDFALRAAIERYDLLPIRIDQQPFIGSIVDQIKERIGQSVLVIADITDDNANVFFEAGYAQGRGIPTILICQQDQSPPFDLRDSKIIFYDPELLRDLLSSVTDHMQAVLAETLNTRLRRTAGFAVRR